MNEVIIPALGESISSGILASWSVQDGDWVEEGQTIYELETDKVTHEGMAEVSGTIQLKVAEGDEVQIGATVAVIDASAAAPSGKATEADEPQSTAEDAKTSQTFSPAVKRIAEESGLDPNTVKGSGKDGRVTKADMLAALEAKEKPKTTEPAKPSKSEAPKSEPAPSASERTTREKMTPIRKKIAERLVAAQQNAAMLTTFNEVDMSTVMSTRKQYQDNFVKKHDVKLGFMSFFIKAAVQALKELPDLNAQIDGDSIVRNHFYDIGVAVGTPKGLMVPVIRDCDQKSFAEIESEIIHYAKKAREGKIEIRDLEGGSFTISNGGIYGSMLSTPILNAPQSAILGMHAIKERAVVENGEIVIRPMMYLALSYDHRIVDGQGAVTFLVKVKQAIEDPARLLYEV